MLPTRLKVGAAVESVESRERSEGESLQTFYQLASVDLTRRDLERNDMALGEKIVKN